MGDRTIALLLSGGIDSTAIAYWLKPDICITIDYGQPAFNSEMRASEQICGIFGISHTVIKVRPYNAADTEDHINAFSPNSSIYWPIRNQMLITSAAAYLGSVDSAEILIGILKDDIYTDCSEAFVDSMNALFSVQDEGHRVAAPAINMNAIDLLKTSKIPPDILGATISCHVSEYPCGRCAGCLKNASTRETYGLKRL